MIARRLAIALVSTALVFGGAVSTSTAASADSLPRPAAGTAALLKPQVTKWTESVDPKLSPEFIAHLDTLTAEQRQAILNELPKTVTYTDTLTQTQRTTGASTLATRNCWTLRRNGDTRGGVNNVLFTFYHVARWCANGSTMEGTDIVDHGASLVGPGWRYEGRPAYDAAVVNNQGRSYSQFKFTFGAGGWDAIVSTPCLRVIASPNGTATTSTTCGIY